MDVDKSMHTKQVNYINRPNFDIGKRPPYNTGPELKKIRNYNIETAEENENQIHIVQQRQAELEQYGNEHYADVENLADNSSHEYEYSGEDYQVGHSDIHFLE